MRYLLIAVLFLSVSCNKKYCWVCHIHETEPKIGRDTSFVAPMCDKTKSEIRDWEKTAEGETYTRNGIDPVYWDVDCEKE